MKNLGGGFEVKISVISIVCLKENIAWRAKQLSME